MAQTVPPFEAVILDDERFDHLVSMVIAVMSQQRPAEIIEAAQNVLFASGINPASIGAEIGAPALDGDWQRLRLRHLSPSHPPAPGARRVTDRH